jgi:glucose-1-phosphate thymidylyltransferase
MKGLILAAGKGKRLNNLVRKFNLPKGLIPIAGRAMIEYVLDNFQKTKIKDIAIVIPPGRKDKFIDILNKQNLNLKYIMQDIPQGTAKAVELARDFIKNDNFLLAYGDLFTFYDFNKLVLEHTKYQPIVTLLVNKEDNPQVTGLVKWEGEYIVRIVEKPKEKFSEYGSAGLMVLEPIIFSVLDKIQPSAENEYHIGDALQYLIDRGYKVRYKIIDTWRINLNRPEDILNAEKKLSEEQNGKN